MCYIFNKKKKKKRHEGTGVRTYVIMQTNADVHANSCDVVFSAAGS